MDFLLVDLNKEVHWPIFINGLYVKIYEICRRYLALCLLFTHFLSRMEFLWEKELAKKSSQSKYLHKLDKLRVILTI